MILLGKQNSSFYPGSRGGNFLTHIRRPDQFMIKKYSNSPLNTVNLKLQNAYYWFNLIFHKMVQYLLLHFAIVII